jgi:hypothetical protein
MNTNAARTAPRITALAGLLGLALATTAPLAQAAVVLTTPSLTGFVAIEGFADGTPESFSVTARDLDGSITATVLPAGTYGVSAQGTVSFTGFDGMGGTVAVSVTDPLAIFSGAIVPVGATPGDYGFTFMPGTAGVNDTLLGSFGFSVSYDGSTSPEVLGFLNALFGGGFVDPTGSGTITVDGDIYSDGFTMDVVESDLTWLGFGALALAVDTAVGGANGVIDGQFTMRDVTVTAVSAPPTLALGLAALALMAGLARRRS